MPHSWNFMTPPARSFAGFPVCTQLDDLEADIAIIGLHYLSPYPHRLPAIKEEFALETAPDAIRRQSSIYSDHYLITIDTDAFDTAIPPGVLFASPGGLTFDETTDLARGISQKGSIVGINLFEVRPELDINNLTASTGAQLIINFIGMLAHSGQFGE